MSFEQNVGSRAQVWHGTAKKTKGGLTKSALMKNKHGRIVSRKMHFTAKKQNRLVKAGYITKKGQFGFIKNGTRGRKGRKGSRKMRGGMAYGGPLTDALGAASGGGKRSRNIRGGMAYGGPLSPLAYDGQGVGTSGVRLQMLAGNATGGGKRSRSRQMRGGMPYGGPLSPLAYDGAGVKTSGVDLQLVAGNAA